MYVNLQQIACVVCSVLTFFGSVEDLSGVPFWSRPRCLDDANALQFEKPLFDTEKETSMYMPRMIDVFNKQTPLYPHPRSYTHRVSILP